MHATFLAVTFLTVAANSFLGHPRLHPFQANLVNMARVGVSESWLTTFGVLKAAGALGLLVGIALPLVGTAAAIGLTLFFVGAIVTHLRARDYSFGLAVAFLLLAVGALVLRLAQA
jgi:hypothetical protein